MFKRFGSCFAFFFLVLVMVEAADAIDQGPFLMGNIGVIRGQILIEGKKPMPGGQAGFFNANSDLPPQFGTMRRIPDRVAMVDEQGGFTAALPAGSYFLGVIVRDETGKAGPPGPEERSFAAVDDAGDRRIFRIAGNGATQDFGPIAVSLLKSAWRSAEMFTIRGRVIKKDGQPFVGASILIRRHPEAKRPDFIAEQSGKNGQFELHLPAGGPYYLIAKEVPGSGRPQTGRHVGAYTGAEPVFDQHKPEPKPLPLFGRAGETLSGITILMIEVPDSELRKESMQNQLSEQQGPPNKDSRE